jgi:hypothetical protein
MIGILQHQNLGDGCLRRQANPTTVHLAANRIPAALNGLLATVATCFYSRSRLMRQEHRYLETSATDIACGTAKHEFPLESMRKATHHQQVSVCLPRISQECGATPTFSRLIRSKFDTISHCRR